MPLTDAEKREAIVKTWNLEPTREVPFLIEIGYPHYDQSFTMTTRRNCAGMSGHHQERAEIYDYGLPNIKPNLGISITAAAFGQNNASIMKLIHGLPREFAKRMSLMYLP